MKFKNEENLELGMRFYRFETDDEYKIYSIVKLNNKKRIITLMDEETFELIELTNSELNSEYTLLSQFMNFIIAGYTTIDGEDSLNFLINDEILYFTQHQPKYAYDVKFYRFFYIYKYMRRTVFNKMINYILNLNNLYSPLSKDLKAIWELYFSYMSNDSILVANTPDSKCIINFDDVVNNDGKLPDSIFAEAEEMLDTYIFSYEIFKFDDSVNIDNVNMKYFIIYDDANDEYYIVLYVIDTLREAQESIANMNENIDVVNFMLA